MWAQMITMTLKPGKESELPRLVEELRATEQPGSGLVRSRRVIFACSIGWRQMRRW